MNKALSILVRSGRLPLPAPGRGLSKNVLATLVSNISHYGFGLSHDAFARLRDADADAVESFWTDLEAVLKNLTGDDRNMADHVVYKNFPAEVLAMEEADYWLRQVLMYWGLPNELFTTDATERPLIDDELDVRVLHAAGDDDLLAIYQTLLLTPARHTDAQREDLFFLVEHLAIEEPNLSAMPFKENMVALATHLLGRGKSASVDTATDVMRLAACLSGADMSLRDRVVFRKFGRAERRFLLGLLQKAKHLEDDLAARPDMWKRLLFGLHPGDYAGRYPRVVTAHDRLAKGSLPRTFASKVEAYLATRDPAVLDLLVTRPGEFLRRLHHVLLTFGDEGARRFVEITDKLTVGQLLRIERYLRKVNERAFRIFPPRGNWSRLQVVPAEATRKIPPHVLDIVLAAARDAIKVRVSKRVLRVDLRADAEWVKLQTNDSELTSYGRGTIFPIPDNITFLRTASYWKTGGDQGNIWFDNGWNFFDDAWQNVGTCCWTNVKAVSGGAVFSGDPTTSKDMEGRACQLIDLYLSKLAKADVRYAVWNILAYSHKTFAQVDDVYAALQWGEKATRGKLFEPSRVQLSFPLQGETLTKYIAYIDVKLRRLIYLDANLRSQVSSAANNGKTLEGLMPAFVESLDSLPSVHDVFRYCEQDAEGVFVGYTDKDKVLTGTEAFVFRKEREGNVFTDLDVTKFLND